MATSDTKFAADLALFLKDSRNYFGSGTVRSATVAGTAITVKLNSGETKTVTVSS